MEIIKQIGRDELATVYVGETPDGKRVEFVQSLQPPFSRAEKQVIIVSTLFGCPIKCQMCDAGGSYNGKVGKDDILEQIDIVMNRFFPSGENLPKRLKIQFARCGEPSLNNDVLSALKELPKRYKPEELIPSLSTVAPQNTEEFFESLLTIKKELYKKTFQLQFSLHSTCDKERDSIIPVKKWSFRDIARYSERFFDTEGKKITLNFIYTGEQEIDLNKIRDIFSPALFFIKLTPLNPTQRALDSGLRPSIVNADEIIKEFRAAGYETLYSLGELEENTIGSNCGQYLLQN